MKKKLCDHCIGTCDTPDSHCSIRLHMSCTTLSELLRLLEFSKRHLNLMIQLKLTDDDFISLRISLYAVMFVLSATLNVMMLLSTSTDSLPLEKDIYPLQIKE